MPPSRQVAARSNAKWLIPLSLFVVAAIAATAISAGWFQSSSPTPDAPVVVVAPPPPPDAPPADASVAPVAPVDAPVTIHLRITTKPSDATVLLNGERLGRTPLDAEVSTRPGLHVIKIRRSGYFSRKLEVSLNADVTQELTLERSP